MFPCSFALRFFGCLLLTRSFEVKKMCLYCVSCNVEFSLPVIY